MQVSSPWVPERTAATRWRLYIVDDLCGPFWLERRPTTDGFFYLSGGDFHDWQLHGTTFSLAEREAYTRIVTWLARTYPDVDPVDMIVLTPAAAGSPPQDDGGAAAPPPTSS